MAGSIKMEFMAGDPILGACTEACRVASILAVCVEFSFNDVQCLAMPGALAADLAEKWMAELRRELRGPSDHRFVSANVDTACEFIRRCK